MPCEPGDGCADSDGARIAALEATGDYRVLRRVPALPACAHAVPEADEAVGIVMDLETTGLDPGWEEPIELAMVRFIYGIGDGRVNARPRGVPATADAAFGAARPLAGSSQAIGVDRLDDAGMGLLALALAEGPSCGAACVPRAPTKGSTMAARPPADLPFPAQTTGSRSTAPTMDGGTRSARTDDRLRCGAAGGAAG